tara:strand:- start:610 stop:1110 length:501 start_codon:yes stop_codon:yes gene_type:complete
MYSNKKNIDKDSLLLNVGKQIVSIDKEVNYQAIEIEYVGTINIISLLSDDYIIKNNNNKIIILKLSNNNKRKEELFKYNGVATIIRCTIVEGNLNKYNIRIKKHKLDFWHLLGVDDDIKTTWDKLNRNYEDLNYDGYNNKKKYIHRKTTYDNETRKYTTTREIRKR